MYSHIFAPLAVPERKLDHFSTEPNRRKHRGVDLVCRVQLYWHGSLDPVETHTENISSTGFYCRVGEAFSEGEGLKCDIYVPAHGPEPARHLCLNCDASVVRVEPRDPQFGIACRIDKFSIAT